MRAAQWIDEKFRTLGRALERAGEQSAAGARALVRNPTLSLALTTVVLFAVARLPTEIFYSELGVRPEDVGLNSVQVLLQGSAVLLAISVLLALTLVAAFFLLFGFASFAWSSDTGSLTRLLKTTFRLGLFPALIFTVAFSLWLLIQIANEQSDAVHEGLGISPGLYPWRAEEVKATWRGPARRPLPGCNQLFYLGETDGHALLFDAALNTTYRINSEDIELEFPLDCPERSPERDSNS
ncbi:MAG TPA: hypothetical protein VGV69_08205 [Solirubrobacterales bacterium]|nr:hypothetical protein [Solirubrobacterales bacterium]